MKYVVPAIKVVIWMVLMLAFLKFFTISQDNSLSFRPDWFSGDKNYCGNGCQTLVAYSNPGFPIQINGSSTNGHYWLAWTINIATTIIAGVIFAIILRRLYPKKI